MPVLLLPFKEFRPDGGKYGFDLRQALNVLPIHGSFRPMRRGVVTASVVDGPPTGGYVHMYQQSRQVQFMRPNGFASGGSLSAGTWYGEPTTGDALSGFSQAHSFTYMDEEFPNDEDDFIYTVAPSSAKYTVELTSPTGTPTTSHVIRWRYNIPNDPATGWSLTMDLLETTTVRATQTVSGTTATPGWVTAEYALTAPEMAAIVSHADLRIRVTATADGVEQIVTPEEDVTIGGWTDDGGGTTNIWDAIDESPLDTADFIVTPVLVPGGASQVYEGRLSEIIDPLTFQGWSFEIDGRVTSMVCNILVELVQGTTVLGTLYESSSRAGASDFNADTPILADLIGTITDPADLRIRITASASVPDVDDLIDPDIVSYQYGYPDAYSSSTNVTTSSGSLANSWQLIDDAFGAADDASSYILFGSGGGQATYATVDTIDPQWDGQIQIWCRAANFDSANARGGRVTLKDGSTTIGFLDFDLTASQSWTTFDVTLTNAESALISTYSNLRLFFECDGGIAVTQAFVAVPLPIKLKIYRAALTAPSEVRVEWTWGELEVPSATAQYRGDIPTMIVGTGQNLYEVADGTFTDISGTTYATNGGCWRMCSFGNHIVATNFVDEVQFREDNAGNFKDMIATPATAPKARFVAPVHGHLMLANINMAGHYPDEFWWSALQNVEDFEPSPTTQCGNGRVVSAPGEIMGLVGGDYALIFKRRSIHRLDWVGGQVVFHLKDVSTSNGTPYPNSVVEADGMVYWWGYDGFYRYDGQALQKIGGDKVARYLMDTRYSEGAIAQIAPDSLVDDDQIMVGWYDTSVGMVFWEYQGTSDSNHSHRRLICYNPLEDRWSEGDASGLWHGGRIGWAMAFPNTTTDETYEMKGSALVGWTGTDTQIVRLSGKATAEAVLATKRFTVGLDQNPKPMYVELTGVMPTYSAEPDDDNWPNLSIRVRSANDPRYVTELKDATYVQADANERQFFPHDNAGYFFDAIVTIPSMEQSTVVSFDGLWLDYEVGGET